MKRRRRTGRTIAISLTYDCRVGHVPSESCHCRTWSISFIYNKCVLHLTRASCFVDNIKGTDARVRKRCTYHSELYWPHPHLSPLLYWKKHDVSTHHNFVLSPSLYLRGRFVGQGYASDTFALALAAVHLFTGEAPYEEIMEEVGCFKLFYFMWCIPHSITLSWFSAR